MAMVVHRPLLRCDTSRMQRSTEELEALLDEIRSAPADGGVIEMIVRRPAEGEREVVDEAELDIENGMLGDDWLARSGRRSPGAEPSRENQLTIMNSRAAAAVAVTKDRWPLAGDQLYVDMDLGIENLPPGTRLALGGAVVEVSAVPHAGCAKFSERFGPRALRFVNVGAGRELRLRGLNARIVSGGVVKVGDTVEKL